jgi:deoxyhypusine synthase
MADFGHGERPSDSGSPIDCVSGIPLRLHAAPLPSASTVSARPHIPSISASAVLGESDTVPLDTLQCRGYDFSGSIGSEGSHGQSQSCAPTDGNHQDVAPATEEEASSVHLLDKIMKSMLTTGFQATNVGLAVDQIQKMRSWRLSQVPFDLERERDESLRDPAIRSKIRARIFLGYTSNQISSGQREVIRFLVQHRMVDVIVTTAGGIEEDIIKCFHPTYLLDGYTKSFNSVNAQNGNCQSAGFSGRELRQRGINRIGNLVIPNRNYCTFEDWMSPLINRMHDEQDQATIKWAQKLSEVSTLSANHAERSEDVEAALSDRFIWTPSKVIRRIGQEIDNTESVLYWAARNNIPVFCPALTDGSLGDMLYFHSYRRPGFLLDINEDIRAINDLAVKSHCTGQIILGGGVTKHHVCNANLMRNGAGKCATGWLATNQIGTRSLLSSKC